MMRQSTMLFFFLLGSASLVCAAPESAPAAVPAAPKAPELPLPTDPVVIKNDSSFAVGYQLGQVFLQQLGSRGVTGADLDMDSFLKGFKNSIDGGQLGEPEQRKLGAALQALDKQLQERRAKLAAVNAEAGKKFLEENKKKPGVTVTASGLQYEVLKPGTGPKYAGDGKDGAQFSVRYEGRFIDGKKFDGNMQGEPVTFTLQVVPGFREALMAMPTGSIWRLYIPAELGYGDKGAGATIPPGSALIFDLELVELMKAPAPTAPSQPPGQ